MVLHRPKMDFFNSQLKGIDVRGSTAGPPIEIFRADCCASGAKAALLGSGVAAAGMSARSGDLPL